MSPPDTTTVTGYRSGFCGQSGLHDRCRGAYAGVACSCPCHTRVFCRACGQEVPR